MTAVAALLCAGCRHPVRRHETDGCQVADCWCEIGGGAHAPAPPAEPAPEVPAEAEAVAGDDDVAEGRPAQADAATAALTLDLPADVGPAGPGHPRDIEPRRAEPGALAGQAVVGEARAGEEVAADMGPAATALDSLTTFLTELHGRAFYLAPRWYCRGCVQWGPDGACLTCGRPMEPVYLATVPREIS